MSAYRFIMIQNSLTFSPDLDASPLHNGNDKPSISGDFFVMEAILKNGPCNQCGLYPKIKSQGLCKRCFFKKTHKRWVDSRPPKVPIEDLEGGKGERFSCKSDKIEKQ